MVAPVGTADAPDRPVARPLHVLVALTTHRRESLLPALVAEIRSQCAATVHHVRILVVDNDPGCSAESTSRNLAAGYLSVTTPGIAAARQGALDAAGDHEMMVMVDDDVMPEPGWFTELLSVWQDTHAAVVMGHVRYSWPTSCDPWLVDTGYMRRTPHPRGSHLKALATSNVLIDVAQVRSLGVRFEVSLGLHGGEDTLFGRDLLARGGHIVAAPDSVVRDEIPPDRATLEFARRRTLTQGQTRSQILVSTPSHLPRPLRSLHQLAGGMVRLAVFSLGAAMVPQRVDRRRNAVLTRRTWFARGRILGALGRSTPLYSRTSTPPTPSDR